MKRQKLLYRCDIAFFLALLLKNFSAGLAYFPILDDYIQYGSYPLFDLKYVFFHIGTISSRPVASFLDPVLWGSFWNHMWIALLLMTFVHFAGCLLFDRLLAQEGIKITPLLYSIFLLLPITFEGTYWISASSRLVVGMLFAVLTAWALKQYVKTDKRKLLPVYGALCLISFGFYESVMVFSTLLQLFVLIQYVKEKKTYKKLWLMAVPACFAVFLFLYYRLTANIGALAGRAAGFSLHNLWERISSLFVQFGYIFSAGLIRTTVAGFFDGLSAMLASPLWGLCVGAAAIGISAACAFYSKKHRMRAKASLCAPFGLALTLLPLLPHLLVEDVWLTYRSILLCLPGLCILLAPFAAKLLHNRYARMACVFLMVFVFSIGCVNELQTYKKTNALDNVLLNDVIAHLDEDVLAGKKETVLVLPQRILVPQTSYYKDHVKSVFDADWSLTGAVRAKVRNNNIQTIIPVDSLEHVNTEGKLILHMDTSFHITEEQYE